MLPKLHDHRLAAKMVGVPVTFIVLGIPVLGFFAWLLVVWWAFGGMALNLRALRD